MKHLLFLFITILVISNVSAQNFKQVNPSFIHKLDFSDKAKAEWALRDTLMSQISSGAKKWDSLTKKENEIIDKYSEVFEDMWDIVGGGCSWYCGGGPDEVSASSYLLSQGNNNYEAQNAHDLNYKSAWVEGVDGYGIGEYLNYRFAGAAARITDIIVVNGYVKSESAYKNNSRVKKLKVYLNEKPYAIFNLVDRVSAQYFKVDTIGNSKDDVENLDKLPEWTLKFEIMEVYKGDKYDDVAISEIYFDGIDVHCFAKGTKISMADGTIKNIEDLKIGDEVTYWDSKTKSIKKASIEKLEKVVHHNLVTYKFEGGATITATQDHPFLLDNKGWASIKPNNSAQYKDFENINEIQIGDVFISEKGSEKLVDIEYNEEKAQETYTISKLSIGNNFIANGLVVGVEEIKGE